MACYTDGALRELICDNLKIYTTGFDAVVLHVYNGSLLGQIPSSTERELFTRMVSMAVPERNQHWMCMQREMGWAVLHSTCRLLHYRGSVEQVRGYRNAESRDFTRKAEI